MRELSTIKMKRFARKCEREVVHNKTNVMVMEMFIAKCLDGDLATDYI